MSELHTLALRQADQPRIDFALIDSELEAIQKQLARLPTRSDLAKTALGIIFAAAALVILVGRSVLASVTRTALLFLGLAIALADVGPVSAREHRSHEVTREFQREHPCPATGRFTGPCPGYRKDHIVPLACGGPDIMSNLQWQTIADTKAKDRWEREVCGR